MTTFQARHRQRPGAWQCLDRHVAVDAHSAHGIEPSLPFHYGFTGAIIVAKPPIKLLVATTTRDTATRW